MLGPDRLYYIDGTGDVVPPSMGWNSIPARFSEQDVVDPHYRLKISGLGYLDGQVYLHQQGQGTILVWDPVSDAEVRRLTTVNTSLHGGFTARPTSAYCSTAMKSAQSTRSTPGQAMWCKWRPAPVPETRHGLSQRRVDRRGFWLANGQADRSADRRPCSASSPSAGPEYGSLSGLAGDGATEWFGPPTRTVVLQSEEVIENVDFGGGQFAEIRGGMWHDLDGDGIRDDGEPPLEGWTIFLDADGDGVFKSGERSATTDAWGNYVFT